VIIKDEDQVRVLAESVLQGHGHQTLSAGNAEQALALLESKEAIDVLFADIVLHGDVQGGLTLAHKAAGYAQATG
jgi:two-component system, response regulator PdtaR